MKKLREILKKYKAAGILICAMLILLPAFFFLFVRVKAEPEPVSEESTEDGTESFSLGTIWGTVITVYDENGNKVEKTAYDITWDMDHGITYYNSPEEAKEAAERKANYTPPVVTPSSRDLDYILNYKITVDVNDDATLHMVYHIDWQVLDDTTDGPLTWLVIGIPNSHCRDINALSSTIKSVKYIKKYQNQTGSWVRIDLDRAYHKDEIVSFDFELTQDYMYQMNLSKEGETVYTFIPGWFDDIAVKQLELRWNADKVISTSTNEIIVPNCELKDGYYVWTTALYKGDKFRVDLTYPNDAFAFNTGKKAETVTPKRDESSQVASIIFICTVIVFIAWGSPVLSAFIRWKTTAGLDGYESVKKYTVVEYFPNCPTCGAPRPEKKEICEYCNASFVKSKKVL